MSFDNPMYCTEVQVSEVSSAQEWYFPYSRMWVRKNRHGEWEVLVWELGSMKRWLHIGNDDLIHTPEEAMAAEIANRRLE